MSRHGLPSPDSPQPPTYEEVCGIAGPSGHIGFKAEALPPSADFELPVQSSPSSKSDKKVVILIALGLVLILLCASVIAIQMKVCVPRSDHHQESHVAVVDAHKKCVEENMYLLGQLRNYQHIIAAKEKIRSDENEKFESELGELKKRINTLTSENERFHFNSMPSSLSKPNLSGELDSKIHSRDHNDKLPVSKSEPWSYTPIKDDVMGFYQKIKNISSKLPNNYEKTYQEIEEILNKPLRSSSR